MGLSVGKRTMEEGLIALAIVLGTALLLMLLLWRSSGKGADRRNQDEPPDDRDERGTPDG